MRADELSKAPLEYSPNATGSASQGITAPSMRRKIVGRQKQSKSLPDPDPMALACALHERREHMWNGRLTPEHLAELKASALTEEYIAAQTLYWSAGQVEIAEILAKDAGCGGLVIQYPECSNTDGTPYCRVKPDEPRTDKNEKLIKYESRAGAAVRLYIPPSTRGMLNDPSVPLVVTEGEKKCDSLCCHHIHAVGLAGVDCWRQKPRDADGNKVEEAESLPIDDLKFIEWRGRAVIAVFDSPRNLHVDRAEYGFAKELKQRGAEVKSVCLPTGPVGDDGKPGKMGADDFIVAFGVEALSKLIAAALPLDLADRAKAISAMNEDDNRTAAISKLLEDVVRLGDAMEREAVRKALKKALRGDAFDRAIREKESRFNDERPRRNREPAGDCDLNVISDNGDETDYAVGGGRFWYLKRGALPVPLTDFTAQIVEDVTRDDGAEQVRSFVITGKSASGKVLRSARVPAHVFDSMNWLSREWGVDATITPDWNAAGRARYTIKLISRDAAQRHVYAHLGWRKIGDAWCYLHGGGAVGTDGVSVELEALRHYRLPDRVENVSGALALSLALLDVAPRAVTIPCIATTYRAAIESLCRANFTLWTWGETGVLKSAFAALCLNHYGAEFSGESLPANWESTSNELESLAFRAMDVPLVIDDFAPRASRYEMDQLESKAHRLIRAQGNRQGRQRMNRDRTSAPMYYPRGLLWVTGEQVLSGASTNARVLVVEFPKGCVNLAALSQSQRQKERLAHAMRGFIEWLAPQHDLLTKTLPAQVDEIRSLVRLSGQHLRQPEIVAHLYIGIDLMLHCAVDQRACDSSWAEELRAESLETLVELTSAQSERIRQERPAHRFLTILKEMLTQRRVHLCSVRNGIPDDAESFGWRSSAGANPSDDWRGEGEQLGWVDDQYLFLMPQVAYHAVAKFSEEARTPFPVKRETLLKALAEEGISVTASDDKGHQRNTVVERLAGEPRRVLKIRRTAFQAEVG